MISRRQLLAALATTGGTSAPAAATTLQAVANAAGLHFGSSSEVNLNTVADYGALILRNADYFAPNLNWKLLAPTSQDTLAHIDPNIALVTKHGLKLTGYHLLWHNGTPAWFPGLDAAAGQRAVSAHIQALGSTFGPETFAWNVVNEGVDPTQGRADGLRPNAFLQKFGTAYVDMAFGMALQAAPNVLRVYNDYDLELATPEHAARRAAVLRLLDSLHLRAVPVQAVGLQCHLRAETFASSFNPTVFRNFLRDLAARGLAIFITELDVRDLSTDSIAARDQTIAYVYRRFLWTALEERAVAGVMTWGLSDRYSWINDPSRTSMRRPDGTPSRPLPFDDALRPKPALTALLEAFQAAPHRPLLRLS